MSEKLKPCPWCGDTTSFVERADYSSCYVHCNGCGAHGPIGEDTTADNSEDVPGYAQAAELWNRRALESASQPGGGEDTARLDFLIDEGAVVDAITTANGEKRYQLTWPDLGESQNAWYLSARIAIDTMINAARASLDGRS
jgi:hypothetical protein